ncbi:unnamed protein product [Acanthoscelides obtectus]|uniref:Uncharacterized protein n=1 Tax=Acanthoscelides obtectus TaxID=200917 RepID=A0A9P0K509_ACAOB|nr:unnamed protein product [Acanthoscelides obtectus]CAK1626744.1 hypothetical protein AOBTE_LOCUS4055 [Acanthoscelides obtectus]
MNIGRIASRRLDRLDSNWLEASRSMMSTYNTSEVIFFGRDRPLTLCNCVHGI